MSHRNAPLTPEGRRRLCERIDNGRKICHVAAEAGISRGRLGYWYARWREFGEAGLIDGSSRPHRSPNQTPLEVEQRVCALRREHKEGPVQLAGRLLAEGRVVPASTIHRILVRHGISRLRDLDVTGADLREPVIRYEWPTAGAMLHVDVKKLGRIPDGGGWWAHGKDSDQHRSARRQRSGWVYLHTAIDDYTRLAYTEELGDEKGTTAAGFWLRAVTWFARHGVTRIERVLTDNGGCYRSKVFAAALLLSRTRHKRTRPYRPQTNGKVERYHRTLAREWAYRCEWNSNDHRASDLQRFLDRYNYDRPHTALRGKPPITRAPSSVDNLAG